jgi:regulator of sigma E protease
MTNLLPFLFVLGVLVFVHELGHFLMARRLGVRVLTFSLGFGPKILKVKRGNTDYCISAIPLGGYVSMAGMSPEEARGASDEFLSKSKWERFQVLAAGPAMNIVLAILVMWAVLYQGAPVPVVGAAMHPQVRDVAPGDPADLGGIEAGDVILAIDGEPVSQADLLARVGRSAGTPLSLTVRRDGRTQDVAVTPVEREDRAVIGVGLWPTEMRVVEPDLMEAFRMSLARNYEWSGLIFRTLVGLLTADTSPRQLVGPIGIAQLSGAASESGWLSLFTLMAMISLNLGILNLLPIPVLDGGHILVLGLEGVARRDFSARVKERMLQTGYVALMVLMGTVIYMDLTRIL